MMKNTDIKNNRIIETILWIVFNGGILFKLIFL